MAPDAAVAVSTIVGTAHLGSGDRHGRRGPSRARWPPRSWPGDPSGPLQPGTSTGSWPTVAHDGVTAQRAATFTTVVPTALVTASVWPSDGLSVGVGQPIVFTFNHYVDTAAARAAVLSHISVSMSRPVPGGWYWFSDDELHFRPESFWPIR